MREVLYLHNEDLDVHLNVIQMKYLPLATTHISIAEV